MSEYKEKHTYLVKFAGVLSSFTIMLITEKAYYLRRNLGLESSFEWQSIDDFNKTYLFVEDISVFLMNEESQQKSFDSTRKVIACTTCEGYGKVPDDNSTSGSKVCPICYGAKMIIM